MQKSNCNIDSFYLYFVYLYMKNNINHYLNQSLNHAFYEQHVTHGPLIYSSFA